MIRCSKVSERRAPLKRVLPTTTTTITCGGPTLTAYHLLLIHYSLHTIELLTTYFILHTTNYSQSPTYYFLLATFQLRLTSCFLRLTTSYYLRPTPFYLLPGTCHFPLLHTKVLNTHYLITVYYLRLATYDLWLTTCDLPWYSSLTTCRLLIAACYFILGVLGI